jgi:hypothetical protein
VEEGDFITELAREVLRGAELDDLQSLFADEMRVSNSPMGCPTEISPVLIPVNPRPGRNGRWNTRQPKRLLRRPLVNGAIRSARSVVDLE